MTSTRTTTLLPESDCNKYDYVIVGGGTAGTPPEDFDATVRTNID